MKGVRRLVERQHRQRRRRAERDGEKNGGEDRAAHHQCAAGRRRGEEHGPSAADLYANAPVIVAAPPSVLKIVICGCVDPKAGGILATIVKGSRTKTSVE